MRAHHSIFIQILLAVVFCVPAVQAQENGSVKQDSAKPESAKRDSRPNDTREQPTTPVPAILFSGEASDSALDLPQAPTSEIQVAATNQPLSGVQNMNVGSNVGARNVLIPSFSAVSQLGMNSSASGFDGPTTSSYLLGTIDFNHQSDRSAVLVHYTGGGMLSNYVNSAVQDLSVSYSFRWQRWSLLLGDQADFLSESPFGFAGVGGLPFINGVTLFDPSGAIGSFLKASLTPNQTIPTIVVPRLSNTAVAQVEYQLSPRSSWTASGAFGTLNFLGVGYIDSTDRQFQTGYNYQLSPLSTVAVIYRFDDYRYPQFPQTIEDHVAQLGYGRYVTGRLAFQVAAGPSVQMLRGVVTGSSNRVSWAVDGSLAYHMDRTAFLLTYDHLVTGGSGVLVGAQTSQIQATIDHKLSPKWLGSLALGFASNDNLIDPTAPGPGRYNSWYAAIRFNRDLRPATSFFVAYGARLQSINAATCPTSICGTNSVSHEISAGFNFGLRPIVFR